MKVCIIGDSHSAMLVGGAALLDREDLEVTTFAQAGSGPEDVLFDGSVIVADDPKLKRTLDRLGTAHSLDLRAFDLLILATKTATAFNAFDLLKGYRVSDWASTSGLVQKINDPDEDLTDERLITEAALQASLSAVIKTNLCYRLCDQIRQCCNLPIFISRNPLLAEKTLQHRPRFFGLKRALSRGDGDALRTAIDDAHVSAFRQFSDVYVMMQPPETITEGCLTKEEYGRDSLRLASTQSHFETDILHAGPKFGALVLQDILRVYQQQA